MTPGPEWLVFAKGRWEIAHLSYFDESGASMINNWPSVGNVETWWVTRNRVRLFQRGQEPPGCVQPLPKPPPVFPK